ncbi:TonB-dependent receptor [Robertkochia aurantiaca]|uniref:TonB-dependent receptor n=1 Tax=Robertkochia aurantiaca TaxID=2873700 RepID=UPI001CCFB8E9|nr:carboxypeptidase regulatory-like domain-containing protein [Robertkochia sp. 3YJGBD-33]
MKHFYLAVTLLLVSVSALAQVTTSNLKGLVTDFQGEPLPGASVVAVHTPTGTTYGGATNFDGRFNLLNMRVGGPYTVTISYIGFQSQEITGIYLELGKTYTLDVQLLDDSQQLDEVVVVADRAGTFASDRTGAETSVGRKELTRLPTISRSAQDFTRLEPTASGNSFAGRNDQFNNFSLDGAIFNNPFGLDAATPGGQTDAQPISLDAIEQIQVSIAPYDVTLSGFTGASVNAVTKSGTNEFYGTAYGFFRNEDLTGGKIEGEDVVKPKLEQNQYGFSIGGPIVKNKLFFFANFERDERTDIGTAGFVPNNQDGNIAINESRVTVDDLMAVQNALSGIVIGQDDQGNDIFYNPGRYEGFTFGAESTKGILKLDWNINDNNRLAVIYNFLNASKEKPAHPTALGFRGPNNNTLQFENAGYEINNNIQSVQVELNSTLSDKAVNKLQVGYTHFDDFRNPLSSPAPSITIQEDGSNYIIAGHEPFSINNRLDQKVFQLTDNMNFFVGEHTVTVGFSFEKFQFDNSFNLGAYGAAGVFFPTASSVDDFLNQVNDGTIQQQFNDAIGVFETSEANGTGNPGGWALAETNVGQLAFYAQDEWNITEDFKITAGVRFDKPMYFDTKTKIQENIDRKGGAGTGTYQPDIVYFDPETGEETMLNSLELPSNDFLVSPRLGFNWDVKGDNSFKVRGGSGIFTGRFPFVWLGNQVQGVDFFFYQIMDPDFKWPQVWRNSLGADYRFENGLVLTTDLSYTKDLNAAHVQNWGLDTPSGTLQGVDNRAVYETSDKSTIFGGPTNAYVFTNSDKGRVWNASFKAQKNFSNGMFASVAYSYLNAKDVNSIEAEITGDAFAGNPVVGNANVDVLGFSKYGDTHRFIGVFSKQFNYGNDHWGTTISLFSEYAQGGRFNYTYGGDINNDGSNFNDLLYIPTEDELAQMNFVNDAERAAFGDYIEQDDYLRENRGSYAERYAALAPWRSRWDIKILQDYNFTVAGDKTNTIQLSLDILNFGNLLNSNWGIVQIPNNLQPVSVSVDETNTPTYSFNPSLTNTFSPLSDVISRWQAQVGLRYIFN